MEQHPLVSCLCVSKGRSAFLHTAIKCFFAQTYKNKQLVLVCSRDDRETIALAESFASASIKIVKLGVDPERSLGELRNISIENADGEYVCNWDDDDWHHPERIAVQVQSVLRHCAYGAILAREFLYDDVTLKAYFSYRRSWENSLLVSRKFLANKGYHYPLLNRSEDYNLVNMLLADYALYPIEDARLYIYRRTGVNVSEVDHFYMLQGYSSPLSAYKTQVVASAFDSNKSIEEVAVKMDSNYFLKGLPYIPNVDQRP